MRGYHIPPRIIMIILLFIIFFSLNEEVISRALPSPSAQKKIMMMTTWIVADRAEMKLQISNYMAI
jgi:hypothetical protein